MRTLTSFACISLVALLSACGTPDDGYYDANGNWIATGTPHNIAHNTHPPLPGGTRDTRYDRASYDNHHPAYMYDRRGYYDYNGDYVTDDSGLNVPQDMFPPRGMCRVWFTNRAPDDQPSVESCNNIKSRVPAGAYVIYGG